MLASIDETTKSLCFPDNTTLTTTSFHEIYHLVSDNFNTPTPSHIESVNSILAEPFTYSNPNSYDNHVAKHLDAHIALDAMLSSKRPLEKCNDFRQSLLLSDHASEFRPFLTIYDAEHLSPPISSRFFLYHDYSPTTTLDIQSPTRFPTTIRG